MAAGNAHLSASVICGGLIEHERSVLLRTKQVVGIERSEIGLALQAGRNRPAGLGGTIEKARRASLSILGLAVIGLPAAGFSPKALLFPSAVSCRRACAGRLANKSRSSEN